MAATANPGYPDRLGERVLVSDRTAGRIELLCLTRELAAAPGFDAQVASRVAEVAPLTHPGCARIRRAGRLPAPDRRLAVISEWTPGWRLLEVLDAAEGEKLPVTAETALHLLFQALSAVAALHALGPQVSHGAIGPERFVVTPEGRVVLADYVFGSALPLLPATSADRLWKGLRLAVAVDGPPKFDQRTDLLQVGLTAIAVLLGRPLRRDEYPGRVAELVVEAADAHATTVGWDVVPILRRWLGCTVGLELEGAGWAMTDAQREFHHLFTALGGHHDSPAGLSDLLAAVARYYGEGRAETADASPDSDSGLPARPEASRPVREDAPTVKIGPRQPVIQAAVEAPEPEPAAAPAGCPPATDAPPPEPSDPMPATAWPAAVTESEPSTPPVQAASPEPPASPTIRDVEVDEAPPARRASAAGSDVTLPDSPSGSIAEPVAQVTLPEPPPAPAAMPERVVPAAPTVTTAPVVPTVPAVPGVPVVSSVPVVPTVPVVPSVPVVPVVRAVEARRDEARAATAPAPVIAGRRDEVERDEAKPAEARPVAAARPAAPRSGAVRVAAVTEPWDNVGTSDRRRAAPLRESSEPVRTPPPVAAPRAPERSVPVAPPHETGAIPARATPSPRSLFGVHDTPVEAEATGRSRRGVWMAAAAAVLAVVALGIWQLAKPATASSGQAGSPPVQAAQAAEPTPAPGPTAEPPATRPTTPSPAPAAAAPTPAKAPTEVPATTGSEPAAPATGSIQVVSRLPLDITEGGRSIGHSGAAAIPLPPGHHILDVVNAETGYRSREEVDVRSGRTSRIEPALPTGTANINAIPWAEVTIDGERAGETPLGNLTLPIGPHQVEFRHPQLGVQTRTLVVAVAGVARLSVEMTK